VKVFEPLLSRSAYVSHSSTTKTASSYHYYHY
jgi:hypothetical protein